MVQNNTKAATSSGRSIKIDRSLRKIATSATTPAATAETTAEINGTKINQYLKVPTGIPAASSVNDTAMNTQNRRTNAAGNHIDHLPRDVRGIDKTRRDNGSTVAEAGPSRDIFMLHLRPDLPFWTPDDFKLIAPTAA
jgi:hypothetical protein